MYQLPQHQETRLDLQHELIETYPLGLLISGGGESLVANAIPFILKKMPQPFGMLQAHIARALCINPMTMLFDEPTSALDPEMIKKVLDVMVDLAQGGMTMPCFTHEMPFARQVANRLIFMDQGQIVEQNEPNEFFLRPKSPRTKLFLEQILH